MPEQNDFERAAQEVNRAAQDLNFTARDISRELRATSRLVQEAAQMGKDELLRYVNESMASARRRAEQFAPGTWQQVNVSRSEYRTEQRSGEYHYSYQKASQQTGRSGPQQPAYQAVRQQPRSEARKSRIRPVTNGRWALFCVGLPLLIAGGICALVFSGQALAGFPNPALGIVALGIGAPGLGLVLGYCRKSVLGRLYSRIRTVVGDKPSIGISAVKSRLHITRRSLEAKLEDMVARGYFGEQARLDLDSDQLIVDPARAAKDASDEAARVLAARQAAAKAKDEAAMDEYERMLTQLRTLNECIEDDAMSERIYRIEAVTRATFAAVKEKPEKKAQLRRFMDYYLPTTIKLLDAYAGFEKQDVTGENIRRSKENIENMTATMADAFEKQFDSLFLTESIDIGAEVRTMDSLLRQDGLIGGMNTPSPSSGSSAVQREPK